MKPNIKLSKKRSSFIYFLTLIFTFQIDINAAERNLKPMRSPCGLSPTPLRPIREDSELPRNNLHTPLLNRNQVSMTFGNFSPRTPSGIPTPRARLSFLKKNSTNLSINYSYSKDPPVLSSTNSVCIHEISESKLPLTDLDKLKEEIQICSNDFPETSLPPLSPPLSPPPSSFNPIYIVICGTTFIAGGYFAAKPNPKEEPLSVKKS